MHPIDTVCIHVDPCRWVFRSSRVIMVFTVFRLLTDFVYLYTYEFWLSLCKIVRSSVILLLPLYTATSKQSIENRETVWRSNRLDETEFFSQYFVFFQLVPQNKHGLSMFGIHFTGTYTYGGKSSYCIYKNNSFIVEPKIVPISRENIINNLLGYIIVQ